MLFFRVLLQRLKVVTDLNYYAMSAAPIYKIVYSYLNVLQTVKNSQNLCWDENSFSNAFKWAELCRKVEKYNCCNT